MTLLDVAPLSPEEEILIRIEQYLPFICIAVLAVAVIAAVLIIKAIKKKK